MIQHFFDSTQKVRFSIVLLVWYVHAHVATVPTLVVPYENSLMEGVESRFKALIDTKVSGPSCSRKQDLIFVQYRRSCNFWINRGL